MGESDWCQRCVHVRLSPTHHGQRVAQSDRGDASSWIERTRFPFREDKGRGILSETVDVLPTFGFESLSSDLQERLAEVDEVDGVKVSDGEVLVPWGSVVYQGNLVG
jgi:hypothetical protein